MEALLIIGALAAGAHYMTKDDAYPDNAIHSTQTTQNISEFHKDVERANMLANVDWSKPGNFVVGDSPETGVQWVIVTN